MTLSSLLRWPGQRQMIVMWALAFASAAAGAQQPGPDDFAYGADLAIDDSSALHKAALPLAVYRYATRPDFGDVRVFNGAGEAVPHSIQPVAAHPAVEQARRPLPYYPIYTESGAILKNLSLQVETSATGTILSLNDQPAAGATRQLSAYLIDAADTVDPLQALELDWRTTPASYTGTVSLAASDDLGQWRIVVAGAALAALRYQGQVLEQRRIEFGPTQAKYLRLSWSGQAPPEITGIKATTSVSNGNSPREWLSSDGRPAENSVGEYDFDLAASIPIDRLQVELPQKNTLIRTAWLSRASTDMQWQTVTSGAMYRLNTPSGEVRNPAIQIAPRKHRHWRLQIDPSGGGMGSGVPVMRVGWRPDQLVFVARGEGPFSLAYGAADITDAALPIARLLPNGQEPGELDARPATLGEHRELGGAARLQPTPPPWPWKTYALWAVLGIAVVLLGLMASRLMRQVNAADSTPID